MSGGGRKYSMAEIEKWGHFIKRYNKHSGFFHLPAIDIQVRNRYNYYGWVGGHSSLNAGDILKR